MSVRFSPLKSLEPELVSQLEETLPQSLLEKLNGSLSLDQQRLKFAEYKIRVLEERLRLVRIEKYGPSSKDSPTLNWSSWNWSRAAWKWRRRLNGHN